ncbi:MBOAT family O-acyltransferase [Leptolyngbya ohadii]|uniref:MBOAT family O-acyltransferase n=1 Tax=Leptolyngbya ohadii TaxID=1962290 RepID=UPI000B5A0BB9|nr:MBOAT family protein [Leptolyngbya ohadii]
MSFLSITYGLFLLSTLGVFWGVSRLGISGASRQTFQTWIILIASLIFYSSLQIQYVPLLLMLTGITFYIGRAIGAPMDWRVDDNQWQFAQADWNQRRLKLLWVGIILNVLTLLGFKYVPFLLDTIGGLGIQDTASQADWVKNNIIAPLGISFFSFECIAYLVDVYRGAPATHDFVKFAAYKLFFAKFISGPITRFHPFAAQLQTLRFPIPSQAAEGLWLIACGAVKKLLIADHLGTIVGLIFGNIERAGSGDLWLATFAYGLQLYLDFSGYVDVARGSALLMGIDLPQNFDFPYFCTNIATFWRRWHMTLGDWLRNYLYFPLGGSRKGIVRTCLNLMIVMVLAGIWHGAAWGFVVWGCFHGLALVVHRLTDVLSKQFEWLTTFWKTVPGIVSAWFVTQLMVFTTWIFFRLPNLKDSGMVVGRLFGHAGDIQFAQKVYVETLQIDRLHIALLLGAIVLGMGIAYLFNRGLKLQLNWAIKLMLVPLCFFAAWLLAPNESQPYIYFDF